MRVCRIKHLRLCMGMVIIVYIVKSLLEIKIDIMSDEEAVNKEGFDKRWDHALKVLKPKSNDKSDSFHLVVQPRNKTLMFNSTEEKQQYLVGDYDYDYESKKNSIESNENPQSNDDNNIINQILLKIQANTQNRVISEELQTFLRTREDVYAARRNKIEQECKELDGKGNYGAYRTLPLHRLRWLTSHGIVMCFIPKVGTSTWTEYLLESGWPGLLKNVSHWHNAAYAYLKSPFLSHSHSSKLLFEQMSKIIIVRHPFARIVSAYKDKIKRKKMPKLNRRIITAFRNNEKESDNYPTFLEFIRFLVQETSVDDSIKAKVASRTDRHWFHYYANCAPCDIQYDVVAKMESVAEDTRYIIEKFNLNLPQSEWRNHVGAPSELEAIEYFKNIPANLTIALYERYKVDFLMFEYAYKEYLGSSR